MAISRHRYLLFQVRKPTDPMREQEVGCFCRALECSREQIDVLDLIHEVPTVATLDRVDAVLMGGSGDYSVAQGGEWLEGALDSMRELHRIKKPTFGSCWGFQAMAKALGGEVVTDIARAEVGTYEISLTPDGERDVVLGPTGPTFTAFEGHQDIVTRLPENAKPLAVSKAGIFQSFTMPSVPIYCTQFHPELNLTAFLQRVEQYPEYVERVHGITLEEFVPRCKETPKANQLLSRFVREVLKG